jgi:hypothetical protein
MWKSNLGGFGVPQKSTLDLTISNLRLSEHKANTLSVDHQVPLN